MELPTGATQLDFAKVLNTTAVYTQDGPLPTTINNGPDRQPTLAWVYADVGSYKLTVVEVAPLVMHSDGPLLVGAAKTEATLTASGLAVRASGYLGLAEDREPSERSLYDQVNEGATLASPNFDYDRVGTYKRMVQIAQTAIDSAFARLTSEWQGGIVE